MTEFYLVPDSDRGYKLSPEEFALFQNVPVDMVQLEALDLTRENYTEFRRIMRGMKIKSIDYYEENYTDFEITINEFGPGGVYETI